MPDNFTSVPESKIVPKKRGRISFVWVIPIVAAIAGGWIAVDKIMSEGPKITITFQSGDGLDAGKTKIMYDGLPVGKLTAVKMADDHKHVIATAEMDPKAKDFLVKDTKFWVVKPRMTGLSFSGLGTILSGNYIGVEMGQSQESERSYIALDAPPIVAHDTPGRFFMLKTAELGSLNQGTPIYYRQLQAGEVVSWELDPTGHFLNVKVFIQSPYDKFVTPDTRFWQASGIDMTLSANGLHVETQSIMSILAGGIAFETPTTDSPQPPAGANAAFTLYNDRSTAFRPPPRDPQSYLLVFNQSVRGLTVGAPVTMNGVTVGEVTAITAEFDAKTATFTVPVTVSLDPARYGVKFLEVPAGEDSRAIHRKMMDTVVAKGLRAQLKTGSLISGALYVSVDFYPDAPPATMDWAQNPPRVPTMPGSIEGIESSLAGIMKKIDQMQFKEISDDLRKTFGELDKTLVGVRGTLTNADLLLNNAGQLVNPNSVLMQGLDGTVQEMGEAAKALRVLMDYLERHPEALIRGKTGDSK
ncbi:MAG: MlaD family protein [Verrucomicrobiota bacterium]